MRFLKLRIRDWRGVTDHEVSFAPTGVTVIEGDNELGKTSLAEAIDLLFDSLDSSIKAKVKAVRPVGQDVGSRAEIEVETGPYRFIYRKRFHKHQATELLVVAPTAESLVGRDAHARVQEILAETVDVPLWKALRLQQGDAIDQANLTGQTSLAAALDAAAAADLGGDREETLYGRVRDEWLKYWTPTNKPVAGQVALERASADAKKVIADVERRLAELAVDVERCDVRTVQVKAARQQNIEDLAERDLLVIKFAELEKLSSQAHAHRVAAESEQQRLALATTQFESRQKLLADVADAGNRERHSVSEYDGLSAELPELVFKVATARNSDTEQQKALVTARKDAQRVSDDMSHLHDVSNLTSLRERQENVRKAREQSAAAAEILAANQVDAKLLKLIEPAYLAAAQAEARLNTDGPRVEITGGSQAQLRVDDVEMTLRAGQQHSWTVIDQSIVQLPGDLRLTVRAGRSLAGAQAECATAQDELSNLLEQAHVPDVTSARQAASDRHEAATAQQAANTQLTTHLRDLTEQGLDELTSSHEARISAYQSTRSDLPPLPPDTGAARKLDGLARDIVFGLELTAEMARKELNDSLAEEQRIQSDLVALRTVRETLSEEYQRLHNRLSTAQESASDAVVASLLDEASHEAGAAEVAARAAERTYADTSPDAVSTALDNVRDVIRKTVAALHDDEHELTALRSRLQLRGEQDLYDELVSANSLDEVARSDLARGAARAAAARRLYETMTHARTEAQEAYVGPLRDRIESFAKVVFGSSVRIELDSELRIAARVLDGKRVEFDSLSMGAREQLSLLSRLACACLVSEAGGAPLVLDDALGNSDPRRLRTMGAVLALAGKSCQVIILTCLPDRYRHVGDATVIRLSTTGSNDQGGPVIG